MKPMPKKFGFVLVSPVYVLRRVDLLRSFRSHGIDIRIGLQFRQSAVEILAMQNRYLY
jgi:hypothetical protein